MSAEVRALIERFDHLRNSGVCSPTTRGLLDDAQSLLSALSTPPADDVREEAERLWPVMVIGWTDSDGSRFEYESTKNREFREAFIAGASFAAHPRGTVAREVHP